MSGALSAKIDVIEKDRSGGPTWSGYRPGGGFFNFSSGFDIQSSFFKVR
jgi:hypothetical protein